MASGSGTNKPSKGRMVLGERSSSGELESKALLKAKQDSISSGHGDSWNEDWDNWGDDQSPMASRAEHVLEIGHERQPQEIRRRGSSMLSNKYAAGCIVVVVCVLFFVGLQVKNVLISSTSTDQSPGYNDRWSLTDLNINSDDSNGENTPAPNMELPPPQDSGVANGEDFVPISDAPANRSEENTTVKDGALIDCGNPVNVLSNLVPDKYSLTLHIDDPTSPSNDVEAFNGSVHIQAILNHDAKCIALHAKNLTFHSIDVFQEDDESFLSLAECLCGMCNDIPCSDIISSEGDIILVKPQDFTFMEGNILLSISYSGLYGNGYGLYKSSEFKAKNKLEVLTVTQLETNGARQVWPGIDEPNAKANFSIELDVPVGVQALSNMPLLASSTLTPDGKDAVVSRLTYETTPKMSPYLIAFAIGSLQSKSSLMASGQNITVWSTVNHAEGLLSVAMDAAVKSLEFYQMYTDFQLPLSKFDLVSVPGKTGAMENFGLLLFDEDRFLFDPLKETIYGKLEAANVICHEVAHQWFGDLVTCKSWADIATNEGFASFFEYKCMRAVLELEEEEDLDLFEVMGMPAWKKLGVHFPGPRQHALTVDGHGSHPIVSKEVHFDGIAYSKGASIVKMVEDYMESMLPGSFQKGIQQCLKANAYSTITFEIYLDCLSARLHGIDLKAIFHNWLYEPGYPTLEVKQTLGSRLEVVQSSNLTNGSEASDWSVPVRVGQIGHSNSEISMVDGNKKVFEVVNDMPVVLNHGAKGYYRVHYSDTYLAKIVEELISKHEKVNMDSQWRLTIASMVSSIFELSNQGARDVGVVLDFLRIAKPSIVNRKAKYSILIPILSSLNDWHLRLRSSCSKDVSKYIQGIVNPFLSEMNSSSGDGILEDVANIHLLANALSHGIPSALNATCAYPLFNGEAEAVKTDGSDIDNIDMVELEPNTLAVFMIGRAQIQCDNNDSGSVEMQVIEDCLLHESRVVDQQVCLYALSQLWNSTLIEGLLQDTLTLEVYNVSLTSTNAQMMLKGLIRNPAMQHLIPNFVIENYHRVNELCHDCVEEAIKYNSESLAFKNWLDSDLFERNVHEEKRTAWKGAYDRSQQWSRTVGSNICTLLQAH